jgi:hypothetical protein
MAMYGSGVVIGLDTIQQALASIRQDLAVGFTLLNAVVAGRIMCRIAVQLSATAILRAAIAALLASALFLPSNYCYHSYFQATGASPKESKERINKGKAKKIKVIKKA